MSDYIERDAAIQAATADADELDGEYIAQSINDLPAAQVREVVKGRWVLQGKFCGINRHECSVCKGSEFRMSNFCPNCGADMREEEMIYGKK